jgi:hypothetical protein
MDKAVFWFFAVLLILQGCATADHYGGSASVPDRRTSSDSEITSSAPPSSMTHVLEDGIDVLANSLSQGAQYIAENYPRSPQQYFDEGMALYDKGDDYPQAAIKLRKAADLGHFPAQYQLAVMYQEGTGIAVNTNQAHRWFHESAVHGHTPSQYQLAMFYYLGLVVPRDLVKSYAWFSIASSSAFLRSLSQASVKSSGRTVLMKPQRVKSSRALRSMKALEKQLTPAQISAAQVYARHCVASHFEDCR